MTKVLVIPDIHGRDFWKKCKSFEGEIIFLGDYHDPYPRDFENCNYDYKLESISNLLDIIAFKNRHQERVTLLLGNHDLAYIDQNFDASRKDYEHANELYTIFQENISLFCGAKIIDNILFTHAGLSQEWYQTYFNSGQITENILQAIINHEDCVKKPSSFRGGNQKYSGPLWMDYREIPNITMYGDYFQIFGHTQNPNTGEIIKQDNWAMIDSRAIFEVQTLNPKESLKIWEE